MEESAKTEAVKKNAKKSSGSGSSKEKNQVALFWDGLKAEFGKIMWPTRETVGKQTVAVVIICAVAAALIAVLDYAFGAGLNFLQNLQSM